MTNSIESSSTMASLLQLHFAAGPVVADPRPWLNATLAEAKPPRLVSFDVFDTLIWRRALFPHDVFLALSARLPRQSAWIRRQAERIVTAVCRRLLRREPTLRDIYRVLPIDTHRELVLEAKFCIHNPFCLAAVTELRERGIPVIAISDMYLGAHEIGDLLGKCGFPDISVYSSASENCTKSNNGDLFNAVWKRMGIHPSDTVHVGDNPHSDIAMATRFGASACQVATPRATLFDMHPATPTPNSVDDSLFWGELAIRLHLETASGANGKRRFGPSIAVLAERRKLKPLSLEESWEELKALADFSGDGIHAD